MDVLTRIIGANKPQSNRIIQATSDKVARAKPDWWGTDLPWRALRWRLPLQSVDGHAVVGIVVHRNGQYGWSHEDWVNGRRGELAFHYGLDVIGWIADSGSSLPLNKGIVCCSPLEGVATCVEPDEHKHLSVVLRHSSAHRGRRRFSFFGDLEDVYIKKGHKVIAGASIGRPCLLWKNHRFFHFGIGYEIEEKPEWNRIYINPTFSIDGRIEIRGRIPWTASTDAGNASLAGNRAGGQSK
jgi:hypothetical protein